jgi:protoporphyrin/coproporphyrin ferrochelatase
MPFLLRRLADRSRPKTLCRSLKNVLRGKNVPRERMLEVAEHYYHFGGKSPINDQNRQLIAAIEEELAQHGPPLPVYWGNRNWHPMLADTLRKMQADGVRRALAFVTSAYSSYSSCRQYREDIARAQETVGEGAPVVDKIRVFHNHPGFIEAITHRVKETLETIPQDRRDAAHLIYTAHSIPMAMAQTCDYETQLKETCRLVTEQVGRREWRLVYQSRSGRPGWSPTSSNACDRSTSRMAHEMLSSLPSVLFQTTWRYCLTWTPKRLSFARIGLADGQGQNRRHASKIRTNDPRIDLRANG